MTAPFFVDSYWGNGVHRCLVLVSPEPAIHILDARHHLLQSVHLSHCMHLEKNSVACVWRDIPEKAIDNVSLFCKSASSVMLLTDCRVIESRLKLHAFSPRSSNKQSSRCNTWRENQLTETRKKCACAVRVGLFVENEKGFLQKS
jgi:hypothetical protein